MSRTIERKFRSLRLIGCNISNMQDYFGYKNEPNCRRKIQVKRSDENIRNLTLTIKINRRECDVLESYIKELPGDVNNYIYEFLAVNRKVVFRINLSDSFPFDRSNWTLLENKKNRNSLEYTDFDPNELYCLDSYSPAMLIDKEILIYVSRLDWFN